MTGGARPAGPPSPTPDAPRRGARNVPCPRHGHHKCIRALCPIEWIKGDGATGESVQAAKQLSRNPIRIAHLKGNHVEFCE
eukprot:1063066-Pelagomonas_calceolata.AAC.9